MDGINMDDFNVILDEYTNEKHLDRLQFLLKFFVVDLMITELFEETFSIFCFLSDNKEYERKVYDCGEDNFIMLL